MSWQVGAFGLLALALAAGFAWYERERPDARIVALVGTLAAFAALGRIAFAAVPNVKPTTDIVLIAGYALGGAPGFTVGALAALTSNFFFGQGPWTPWQMAAWGATGVLGAALAWGMRRGTGAAEARPLGRWPLAIACCAAGFAFTVVQDVGDWVSFSDHSAAQLAAYVGQGLGFDAVHAAGCLAFALALGPVLTRSIQRFARRITVTWIAPERVIAPLLVAALALGALGSRIAVARAAGATSPSSLTTAAANYLLGSENADGGFGSAPGQPSDQLYAGWAALGLASAGHDLNQLGDAESLVSYIARGAGTHDVGALERTILVVRAAGRSPRSFGGRDLIAALQSHVKGDGSISDQVNLTAFAILALHADGLAPSGRTLGWLAHQQDSDGGFSFAGREGSSDVDDTGAALEALAGEHAPASVISRAVAFLRRQQGRDGGFPSQPGMGSNAQSTAWAIQGLQAAGVSAGDAAPRWGRLAAGLPRRAGGRQRCGALQPRCHPDPGVGDRRGAHGDGGQAASHRGARRARGAIHAGAPRGKHTHGDHPARRAVAARDVEKCGCAHRGRPAAATASAPRRARLNSQKSGSCRELRARHRRDHGTGAGPGRTGLSAGSGATRTSLRRGTRYAAPPACGSESRRRQLKASGAWPWCPRSSASSRAPPARTRCAGDPGAARCRGGRSHSRRGVCRGRRAAGRRGAV